MRRNRASGRARPVPLACAHPIGEDSAAACEHERGECRATAQAWRTSWLEWLKRNSRNSASRCRRRRHRSPTMSPSCAPARCSFVSGQICLGADGKLVAKGKLGDSVSVEDGQKAARACAINLLAQVKVALGDLDKVVRVVRLGGFINPAPTFLDGPKVMNGASDLMVEVLRRQGPACAHHRRRRGAAGRCGGRGRRHVRGRLTPTSDAEPRLADRAPDRAPRPARCRERHHREHAVGLRGRDRRQLRHRMRPADHRRRRGHGAPRRRARPADRRQRPARRA